MLNSCYCLEYSSLAVICRCLTNTSLSSTALTSSFAWFLWGFFWQPLRSKNTLSASVQIPVTCKPGLYPRYLEGAVCGAAAAEMIQGYGEHFGSCGCLCPFVESICGCSGHQHGPNASIKLIKGKKKLVEAKLLLCPRSMSTQGSCWGRGRFEFIPLALSHALAGLARLCPCPRCYGGQRCPLQSLSVACPPQSAFAQLYGDLLPPCLVGLAMTRKYVLSSQWRARNVKNQV